MTATPSILHSQKRLVSLDVFRGITIAIMILVNNPGGDTYYPALQHAEWNGLTLADLVFPFFLFIVGVAIPYSFAKKIDQGYSKKKLLSHVIRRSLILFALGLLVNGFPYFDLSTLRIMGVLQRIAICYLVASIIFLAFKTRGQLLFTILIPLFYWASMSFVPVPGYGAGVLGKEGNLAQYIDNLILGSHNYKWTGNWDPEGILSTISAIATTLIGVLTGQQIRTNLAPANKVINLSIFGSFCVAVGLLWNIWFPINKNLWTSSYVAFTGGIALIFLAMCYLIIEIKKYSSWAKPFIILGANSIFIYVLSEILNLTLIFTNITLVDGTSKPIKTFIYENYFSSWAGPLNGSLFYALAYLMIWLVIAAILYKKRILIKV